MPEIAGVVAFREPNPGDRKARRSKSSSPSVRRTSHLSDTARGLPRQRRIVFPNQPSSHRRIGRIVTRASPANRPGPLRGCGTVFHSLGGDFHHIVSVESSQTSSADLSYNQSSNGETVQATTEQYLARAENSGRVGKGTVLPHTIHKPDLAVVDPPRSGLGERVARMLASLGAPRVVYVSCDPATLARDLFRCSPPVIASSKCTSWIYFRKLTTWRASCTSPAETYVGRVVPPADGDSRLRLSAGRSPAR